MADLTDSEKLLACLRLEDEPQKSLSLEAFQAIDWEAIVEYGEAHRLLPYLYWHLDRLPSRPNIPEDLWQDLRSHLLTSARKNLLLLHQFAKITSAFIVAGIPSIALKGIHLAELVYDNLALRPMADIDLLTPFDQLELAYETMIELGYTPYKPVKTEKDYRKHQHLPPFLKASAASVEIHWITIPPSMPMGFDPQGLWDRAQPATIAGLPTRILSPEDLLIHLCTHTCQHEFNLGLKPLVDITETIIHHRETFDWPRLLEISAQRIAGKFVYLPLLLAQELLRAPVPASVLKELRPADFDPQIAGLARERVLNVEPIVTSLHPDLAGLWGESAASNKLQAIWNILFPPPQHVASRYGLPLDSKRAYLYYPVRWVNLVYLYSRQLWRLLRRDQAALALAKKGNTLADWLLSS